MLCSSELYSIGSVAFRTLVNFLSRCQGNRFGFAQLMLPLCSCYPVLLSLRSRRATQASFARKGQCVCYWAACAAQS